MGILNGDGKRHWLRNTLIVITGAILIYFFIYRFAAVRQGVSSFISILSPFLAGALIAFLLKPICNRLDRVLETKLVTRVFSVRIAKGKTTEKRVRALARKFSVLIAMIAFALIVAGILLLIIPSVVDSVITLKNDLPSYLESLSKWVNKVNQNGSTVGQFIYDTYNKIVDTLSNSSGGLADTFLDNYMSILNTAGSVVSFILNLLIDILVSIVSAVYILYNRKRFADQANLIVRAAFNEKTANWLIRQAQFTNRKFTEFFTGKLLDSFIVGVILYIVLSIVRIPNAPLIAVFMACCNMIPFFGPYIGAFPCGLIVLMADTSNPINVIYFIIIVVIVQQFDGNILDPYIVGDNIGLSGFWVLFAVLLFGDLLGFVGLLIGVPLFAVIYDMIRQLVEFGLRRRGQEQHATNYNFIYHDPEEERAAMKKRAAAIKQARKEARERDQAAEQEAIARELAVAQAAAAIRAEQEAEARAREEAEVRAREEAEAAAQEAADAADVTAQETETVPPTGGNGDTE